MKIITDENKREIFYNVVNGLLAGALVLLGSFATGNITRESLFYAVVASGIVFVSKLKEYWDSEKQEYSAKLFNFVG